MDREPRTVHPLRLPVFLPGVDRFAAVLVFVVFAFGLPGCFTPDFILVVSVLRVARSEAAFTGLLVVAAARSAFGASKKAGHSLMAESTALAAVCPKPQRLASVIVQPTSCNLATSSGSALPPATRCKISFWR